MIPHSRPTIGAQDMQSATDVLASGCLAQGEQVARFEEELAGYTGGGSAVAVNSGTSALHLALLALDVGAGDEVVIPTYVCTALWNAVRYTGAAPVLADADLRHGNLDAADVERRLTPRTKAIIVPHLFGQSADLSEILRLGVPVIEDCAQSLGSTYQGQMTGSMGTLAIFSFYATKLIATGEGGMVMSRQEHLAERVRDLRDYDEKDDDTLRFNYKMTDLQAALGRSQLRQFGSFLERRATIARFYDDQFRAMGVEAPQAMEDRNHIAYRYIIRRKRPEALISALAEMEISCRRPIYKPLHHYLGLRDYPVAERLWQESLSIPIYPSLTDEERNHIVLAIGSLIGGGL